MYATVQYATLRYTQGGGGSCVVVWCGVVWCGRTQAHTRPYTDIPTHPHSRACVCTHLVCLLLANEKLLLMLGVVVRVQVRVRV